MLASSPNLPATTQPRAAMATLPWLRHDLDALLVAATLVQAALVAGLLALADAGGVATTALAIVGLATSIWWNANTVAHIHMHRPLFTRRGLNRAFAAWLSLLTSIPQVIWRQRHLWHHAGEPQPRPLLRWSAQLACEVALIAAATLALALWRPWLALAVWAPSFALAMVLCQLQGHFEHARPGAVVPAGISHYGSIYNLLWFNDGYHVEHHAAPALHWRELPTLRPTLAATAISPLPPVLRGGERVVATLGRARDRAVNAALGALEHGAMAAAPLGAAMVATHRRAVARLLGDAGLLGDRAPRVVVIVGGGLFPRTLLALAPLLPEARFVVVDAAAAHLDTMRAELQARAPALLARVEARHGYFDPGALGVDADLVVLPLALDGDAVALAARCTCPVVAHRWVFARARGPAVRVAWWLAKRVELLGGGAALEAKA